MVLHLNKRDHAVFLGDGIHLMLPAETGKDAPGLHLVAVLPEEDPHELLEIGFRTDEGEGSPEIGPVRDGGADGARPGPDHPEDRGRLHPILHRLLDLHSDPVSIIVLKAHVPERPPHLPPVKSLKAAVDLRDVLHQVGSR